MDINDIWKLALTMGLSVMGWFLKDKAAEIRQLNTLVSKTREEMAKEYITKVETFALILKLEANADTAKADFHADINRVLDRIDKLSEKMDRSIKTNHAFNGTERRSGD